MTRPLGRRSVLAGALGVAALPLVTACGGGTTGGGEPLRVAIAGRGAKENLDPHVAPQFVDQIRARACFDTLVGYTPEMTAVPRLAESWEVDATGTRWRIRLRRTRWHDGRPFTAADVLYSFRRIADPATTATAAQLYADVDVTASRAVSDTDVEVVLGNPNFLFPLSWGATGTEIVPQGTTSFANPVGTGPFRYVSFSPDAPARYRSYDGYWGGPPPSPELEIVPIADEQARLGALLSGQVACVYGLEPASGRRISDDGRVRLLAAADSNHQYLCLKVDRPPFSDPRLRDAVRYGIDRDALVRVVLLGRGRVGNDLRGRGAQYYDAGIPQVVRDVDRARSLVDAAGARGREVELLVSTLEPTFVPAARLITEQLAEIGLRATTRTVPASDYYGEVRRTGAAAATSGGRLPIPDYVGRKLVTSGTGNFTGWKDPEVDRLYTRAVSTTDEAARTQAFADVQRRLHEASGNIVWGVGDALSAISADLTGVPDAVPNTADWGRFDKAVLG
ncbi:ABC transporter substrate-binding protein [Pseudonocardia endophytica]|uniref:Peptide/nickel transport system substrate-binding protein n=1 Tax=Pseudonocardia endophytica TaxID=401976 RepID=A0A4R1HZ26_PSEEN|nr:ABC transporter substrate-binding protein [Pseudonocardia endophytica]TCK22842.1 peptide/nickel transport system substrate-binding protein [Pseudonocardia endophytica]